MDKPFDPERLNLTRMGENMETAAIEIARALASFYRELIAKGLSPESALYLTTEFFKAMYGANKPKAN